MQGDRSGMAELMVVQDESAVSSKLFIKLALSLSDVLAFAFVKFIEIDDCWICGIEVKFSLC